MLSERRHRVRRSRLSSVLVVLVLAFFAGPGCDGDDGDDDGTGPDGPFRLTFRLDVSFRGPHGGDAIAIAIVRTSDGSVVVQANGAVSATQDPSFTWSTGPVMQAGIDYEVHYWIDSNIDPPGGTLGVCDSPDADHQWSVELLSVSNDITLTPSHDLRLIEDVCSTFT